MSTTETWTIGRLLTWTTDFLKKAGSESPRLDSEVLLAHAQGCPRIQLYTSFDQEPTEQARAAFREMVRRRADGTPVAYLVGHKEFYSDTFEVNPDVLIPRPETEHLVVEALDRARELIHSRRLRDDDPAPLQIADVGTGSGIIAITLAKHLPGSRVTAIDISAAALEVASRNMQRHELHQERIQLLQSDLLSACEPRIRFDLIVSNPPYVSISEFQTLSAGVRDYEPELALVGGPNGSEVILRLMDQALGRIAPDGFLIFEFSPMLGEKMNDLTNDNWSPPVVTKDLAGLARVVTLQPRTQPANATSGNSK